MEHIRGRPVPPEISGMTLQIERALRGLAKGESLPYSVVAAITGRPMLQNWGLVRTARQHLLKERLVFFADHRTKVIRRADDVGIIVVVDRHLGKARRSARRSIHNGIAADHSQLTAEQRGQLKLKMSRASYAEAFAGRRSSASVRLVNLSTRDIRTTIAQLAEAFTTTPRQRIKLQKS
jgi:hypothetical protein